MLKWRINRTVELTDAAMKTERLKALATMSSRFAHEICVRVQEKGTDADLSGFKVALSLIFPDNSSASETIADAADGGCVTVTLPNSCYAQAGEVRGVIHLADDEDGMLPLYAFALLVGADMTDILRDEANVVPSVAELLAQIETMREATKAAETATQNASAAADDAQEQAKAAEEAAGAADAAAKKLSSVDVEVTMLDSGSDPGGSVTQTEESTVFYLQIPIGPTGPKGDTGATPEITVEVTTGEAGTEATASVGGTAEKPVIYLTIPRGDVGAKGDTGATPDITVEVTTGEAGTEAAASVGGTAEKPIIYLTIPRGDTGEIDGLNYYEETPAAPGDEASPGSSEAVSRGDHVHPAQTTVTGNAGTATKLKTARKIGDAEFDGSKDITVKEIGAYPAAGIRVLEISLPVASWTGDGPYTLTVSEESVTELTDCRFEFSSTQTYIAADIDWETTEGTITLTTESIPTGELSGRVILMEVSG